VIVDVGTGRDFLVTEVVAHLVKTSPREAYPISRVSPVLSRIARRHGPHAVRHVLHNKEKR
jgi:hypothetical protein